MKTNNHFVPQMYLKHWASTRSKVWTYRLLVSHERVPPWKERPIRGIGYHRYLYTRLLPEGESDEIERWLDEEFERPAEGAVEKAISGKHLSRSDWRSLARFVAAQDVRTPKRFMESMARRDQEIPRLIDSTLHNAKAELEEAARLGRTIRVEPRRAPRDFPFRVTVEKAEDGRDQGAVKVEALIGRGMWLFSIRHLLTKTLNVLVRHRWTVYEAPGGISWVTSDDPVVKLNYYGPGRYDFRGGWGNSGADVLMPISPRHVLFMHIGERPRYSMTRQMAAEFQRLFVEHADRMIFAENPAKRWRRCEPG